MISGLSVKSFIAICSVSSALILSPAFSEHAGGEPETKTEELMRQAYEIERDEVKERKKGRGGNWFLGRLFKRKADKKSAGSQVGPIDEKPLVARATYGLGKKIRDADTSLRLARVLARAGREKEALRILNTIAGKSPGRADIYLERAELYMKENSYKLAAEDYNRVITLGGGNTKLYYSLGTAYEREAEKLESEGKKEEAFEKYRDAIAEYKRVLWQEHDHLQAYYSLGCVYTRLGRRDDAIYYFRKTLARAGNNSDLARRSRYNIRVLGGY